MAMQIDTLFLMPDERPQTLMFVCPACERQSFQEATAQLEGMTCKNCGVAINGSKATIEILSTPADAPVPSQQIFLY